MRKRGGLPGPTLWVRAVLKIYYVAIQPDFATAGQILGFPILLSHIISFSHCLEENPAL